MSRGAGRELTSSFVAVDRAEDGNWNADTAAAVPEASRSAAESFIIACGGLCSMKSEM